MILTCWTLKSCYIKNWELFHWMSSLAWEGSDGTGTGRSQGLGSLQQVVDEFLKIDKWKSTGLWTVKWRQTTNVLFTHVYAFFGRLGTIEDVLIKRFKIKKNQIQAIFLVVLLTRINFFLWFSSSMSKISSRSISTSFGNSV